MKQIVQNYKTGELRLEEVPVPGCRAGGVLVRSAFSLISVGTERMKVAQARMNMLQKARARPDKVRQVIQGIRQNGLAETWLKVRERLDTLTPLGYSVSGTVEEVDRDIDDFRVGDRVACAGEGLACHAEFVSVPRNLCAHVPADVGLKEAAFATVGAIAMNGVRQGGATLGDTVVVIGLGLVGLLAVQLLKAAGCHVVGADLDPHAMARALECGAEVTVSSGDTSRLKDAIHHLSGGAGADIAYIAASTSSAEPIRLAGDVLRDRGRVVVVGMVPVHADWQTYYDKELSVVMSRSYGPGRYDRQYERKGIDYPIGYVRWTVRRNMQEFLRLVATHQVDPGRLAPEVAGFDEAPRIYQRLLDGDHRTPGTLFAYETDVPVTRRVAVIPEHTTRRAVSGPVGVGLIGAGNFASATLIPALKKTGEARLRGICAAGGLSARSVANRHGFEYCASEVQELLSDREIDAVVIATHHDTHGRFAAEALRAGKHVFVEKPLALTPQQLEHVVQAQAETGLSVMVGYNRRFSPLSVAVRDCFAGRTSPIEVVCRVNAGGIAADSWYQDPEEGGWRIVSEGCHFVDLIQFICGCRPVRVFAEMIGGEIRGGQNDNCIATIKLADGSLGTLIYVANGDPRYEKERIEVFGEGRAAAIENWRVARVSSDGRTRKVHQPAGKGHVEEIRAFVQAVRSGSPPPMAFREAVACTQATFAIASSLTSGLPVDCVELES